MPLLKDELINQYKKIHTEKLYGYTSEHLLYLLLPFVKEVAPKSILDYGCGQSNLVELLKKELAKIGIDTDVYKYDPAIESISTLPIEKVDLVINTDVLEHIPGEYLPLTIKKILSISPKALFVICNKKAVEILPDGTNAHCSVHPPEWWRELIEKEAGFAKIIPWPVKSTCCITTWDTKATGGIFDLAIKYLAGNVSKFLK